MKKMILGIILLGIGYVQADEIDKPSDYQCTTHGKELTGTIEASNIFYTLKIDGYDKITVTGTNEANKLVRIHRAEGALSFDVWFGADGLECK